MEPTKKDSTLGVLASLPFVAIGAGVAAFGLESFLIPNHFVDGGATGVAMLVNNLTGLPLALGLLIVNAPFVAIGHRSMGREFAFKSSLGIIALAACLMLVEFPAATQDKLLGAVFGGFFIGAGVGLAMRGGAVLDGTEILALILSKRTFATVGEVILALNAAIFFVAGFSLGLEPALYSMLTYFAASRTIEYLLHGLEAYNGVLVFSNEHKAIRESILTELGRGVTVLKATGGFSETDRAVLYCVVTRLELTRVQELVTATDPNAFVVVSPVLEVSGGTVKRRALH